jgi:glutamate racemase
VSGFVTPLLQQGADTLVLGCTHYPFVLPLIEEIVKRETSKPITIIDTGDAVARQLSRLLTQHALIRTVEGYGSVHGFTTGSQSSLSTAFANLLKLHPDVIQVEMHTSPSNHG